MKVFLTNYHIAINNCLVNDFLECGVEVLMPSVEFAQGRIGFFAPNDEHKTKKNVKIISYEEFLNEPPFVIFIPCTHLYHDFIRLYEARGKKDVILYYGALRDTIKLYPTQVDYLLAHDIISYRLIKAKHKALHFTRPDILINDKKNIKKSFEEKIINTYHNNLFKPFNDKELEEIQRFAIIWEDLTGKKVKMFGYDNPDGWLSREECQRHMVNSMFTIAFKRMETWGQAAIESMLLGTPVIFLRKFMISTFRYYLITEDNSIVVDNIEEAIKKIKDMSFDEYETMCYQAQKDAELITDDKNRQDRLKWLLNKIYEENPFLG